MTFKYAVIERLTETVLLVTNNFETAQKIVLSQGGGNKHKKLIIIQVAV